MIQALPNFSYCIDTPFRPKRRFLRELHSLQMEQRTILFSVLRSVSGELLQPRPQSVARILEALRRP